MTKTPIAVASAVFIAVLEGCLTSGPPNNESFGNVEQLSDLQGVYRNAGEGAPRILLSQIIWPDRKDLGVVGTIEVRVTGEDTLRITGLYQRDVVISEEFVEGEDFKLSSGRIQIGRHVEGESGGGVAYAGMIDIDLGLDETGHGKYRETTSAAGLVGPWIPFALVSSEDTRFVRIGD